MYRFEEVVIFHYPGPGLRSWEISAECLNEIESDKRMCRYFFVLGYAVTNVLVKMVDLWWKYAESTSVYMELEKERIVKENSLLLAFCKKCICLRGIQ